LAEDDFLCPICGAIWGDKVYKAATVILPEETDEVDEPDIPDVPIVSATEAVSAKQLRWLLPLMALVLLLAFIALWLGSNHNLWVGEGTSTPATTTGKPTATIPPEYTLDIETSVSASYTLKMLDPAWLCEPIEEKYTAGETVNIKIITVMNDVGYMMLMNGIEITAAAVAPEYLLYCFTMPSEDVTLDLKIITDRDNEDLLRDYYIQYPDKEQVSVLYDYGEYNPYLPCRAVLLKSEAEGSEPKNVLIGGLEFRYVDGNDIQVYRNNRFYTLNIAYTNGYLTRSDLEQIQALHMERYPELYTYDTQPAVDYPD
jgi:hypothetical protein